MAGRETQHALYYTDDLIANLQIRWGEGLMSPGGAEELARMFHGIDVGGADVLDLGCGIGGYDRLLLKELDAGCVTGIDIDGASLAVACEMATREGLADRLTFIEVTPGPLPFEDGVFDVAFSKDAIVDIQDKPPVFGELQRVLRGGGSVVISDWFRSEAPYSDEMRAWATDGEETYEMDTLANAGGYLSAAGFVDVVLDDRNDWFRVYARNEYERLKGPLHQVYVDRFGKEQAENSVENARIRCLLADQGQLRPGHARGRKLAT